MKQKKDGEIESIEGRMREVKEEPIKQVVILTHG